MHEPDSNAMRRQELRQIVETYFEALRQKNFGAIPYAPEVSLRAPLAPGGVNQSIQGKEMLQAQWWQPLEPALAGVEIIVQDCYFNEALTAVCAEALITLNVLTPPVTLRVADRFTVNSAGEITAQENHFDPRDVTNPGWYHN